MGCGGASSKQRLRLARVRKKEAAHLEPPFIGLKRRAHAESGKDSGSVMENFIGQSPVRPWLGEGEGTVEWGPSVSGTEGVRAPLHCWLLGRRDEKQSGLAVHTGPRRARERRRPAGQNEQRGRERTFSFSFLKTEFSKFLLKQF